MRKFIFAFFTLIISTTAMWADDVFDPESCSQKDYTTCESTTTATCYWNGTTCDVCNPEQDLYPDTTSRSHQCTSRTSVCSALSNKNSCNKYDSCLWSDGNCKACDNGKYRAGTDATICISCESKYDPPEDASFVIYKDKENACNWTAKCPAGTYYYSTCYNFPYTSCATECKKCPERTYSTGPIVTDTQKHGDSGYNGVSECHECPPGYQVNENQDGCDIICPDHSSPSADNTYCICNRDYFYFENDNDLYWQETLIGDKGLIPDIVNKGSAYNYVYERFKTTKYATQTLSCTEQPHIVIFQDEEDKYYDQEGHLCGPGYYWPGPEDENDMRLWCYKQCEVGYYCEGYGTFDPDEDHLLLEKNAHIKKCPPDYTSNPGATSEKDCYQRCTEGQYYKDGKCQPCPEGYTSPLGATSKEDCTQNLTCPKGQYVEKGSNDDLSCKPCPRHFTSDDNNTLDIKSCYMDPNTKFCDKDENCQTLAQIFGNNVKISYKEQ